jgi:hypothetical protein
LPDTCSLQTKVVLVEFGDAVELMLSQVGGIGGGCELVELFFVVDVRQGRDDLGRGEDELEGGLAQGTFT